MSYLLDFVKTFNTAEMLQFKQLDVIGKEELLRDAYAKLAQQKNFDEYSLPKKFNLSVSHFDKINSVLLHKTIQLFYGSNYLLRLTTLVKKGLSTLMLHELKIMERSIAQQKNLNETQSFYAATVEALCAVFHPNYNEKLAHTYGKKYLESLGSKKTLSDETYVAMRIHQSTMIAQAMAGNEETYRTTAQNTLRLWEKRLQHSSDKQALFHLHFAQSCFVKFYGSDVAIFLEALAKCKKILPHLKQEQQNDYGFKVLCEIAFGNIEAENFKAAEESLEAAFALPFVDITKQSYHSGNYLNVCLINKSYTKAAQIFKTQLEVFLNENINRSLRFDVLVNAIMLHLHLQQFDTAFAYLQEMQAYKRNLITPLGQLLMRICETLFFYCKSDYKMAMVLAKRNIRFLNRPENKNPQFRYHLQFMNCIWRFSQQREKGQAISETLLHEKSKLYGGIYHVFNQLL